MRQQREWTANVGMLLRGRTCCLPRVYQPKYRVALKQLYHFSTWEPQGCICEEGTGANTTSLAQDQLCVPVYDTLKLQVK